MNGQSIEVRNIDRGSLIIQSPVGFSEEDTDSKPPRMAMVLGNSFLSDDLTVQWLDTGEVEDIPFSIIAYDYVYVPTLNIDAGW